MLTTILILSILLGIAIAFIVALAVSSYRGAKRNAAMTQSAIETLRAQFTALASNELGTRTNLLIEQNRREVGAIASGLRDELLRSMNELRSATEKSASATNALGEKMLQGVEGVRLSADALGAATGNLATALTGGGKQQGVWGEAVLANVLKASGLQENVNYRLQSGFSGVGIPDAQVFDSAGRTIVIDSKASLTDYLKSRNAKDGGEESKLLADHVRSVRKHIDELSSKDYIGKLEKIHPGQAFVREVVMFVPNEAAHAAAMAQDPTLVQYAAERGVAIATPSTLLAFLRLVSLAWQQENVERNQEAIAKKAELVLGRIDKFLAAMENVGDALAGAEKSFNAAMGLLGRREGVLNIVTPARELVEMGVRFDRKKAKSRALAQDGHDVGREDSAQDVL